ncbi:NAD(P)H-dependent flavin oxidoreductase [Cysteiniphilum sp. 6C5]|uniref:NAD(P)H-dependent flavin oxidoreductase n=1 Tax=unclassified Cysteiniphilum TaxID=2610889 RepID=UPI003F878DE7
MFKGNLLTQRLGISIPVIQAPMAGGITTPELIAAVSNAGALGSLGAGYMQPSDIEKAIRKIKSLTAKPFAVNLFIPEPHQKASDQSHAITALSKACNGFTTFIPEAQTPWLPDFNEQIQVILDYKIPVFSYTFGSLNATLTAKLKSNNTFIIGTSTSTEQANILRLSQVDAFTVQGEEAGGHRGSFSNHIVNNCNKLHIIQNIRRLREDDLIIAAGAIMTPQDVAHMLSQPGIIAVQMGTAFLTTKEAGTHPTYKKELLCQTSDTTTLTQAFSGRIARAIPNRFIEKMASVDNHTLRSQYILPYPEQHALTQSIRAKAKETADKEYMSLWAGRGVAHCRDISATTIINDIKECLHAES